MKAMILLLVSVMLPANGHAQSNRWVTIGGDSVMTFYVDTLTISSLSGTRAAWQKVTFNTPQDSKQDYPTFRYDETLTRFTARCATHELRTDEVVYRLNGQPQKTYPPNALDAFQPVIPESYGEAEFLLVCARR